MSHAHRQVVLGALFIPVYVLALPLAAHAANIPFWGPIIPPDNATCAAGWGGLVIVINRIIDLVITLLIMFVAPLTIGYAGFLLVVNPINPGAVSSAKSILLNTVIGIVVALAAWMIVNALMAVLYDPKAVGNVQWYDLLSAGPDAYCLAAAPAPIANAPAPLLAPGGGVVGGVGPVQCSASNPACSVAALQSAGFSAAGANVMSCIAMTENAGLPVGCNGNACGTFQIVLTLNRLTGNDCSSYPVLDCTTASTCNSVNGKANNLNSASCQRCLQNEQEAAFDAKCNAETAASMYAKAGGAGPWVPPSSDNLRSGACVQAYGNSGV